MKSPADGRPEGHHQVQQHRHPRGRHMDEDDAVDLALLGIGRCHKEAEVEADGGKHNCQHPAQRFDAADSVLESTATVIDELVDLHDRILVKLFSGAKRCSPLPLPPLASIANRFEVLFEGAEPLKIGA